MGHNTVLKSQQKVEHDPMRLAGPGTTGSIWGRPVSVDVTRTNPHNHEVSVRDTIRKLREHARTYESHPSVDLATHQACGSLSPAASDREVCCAIYYWIRSRVRFLEDELLMQYGLGIPPDQLDKELLIPPPVLLSMNPPTGDCDDFSLLTACMCLNAGVRPFYVTVAADPEEPPSKLSHIYVVAYLEDENSFLQLDSGNRYHRVPPGWEAQKGLTRKAVWKV